LPSKRTKKKDINPLSPEGRRSFIRKFFKERLRVPRQAELLGKFEKTIQIIKTQWIEDN